MTWIEHEDAPNKFQNITFQVKTPDGMMFVTVLEDADKKPVGFHINIGKAGAAIAAWSQALARIMSLAVDKGAAVNDIIEELSSLTSDKEVTLERGEKVRSGPEGVVVALFNYRNEKFLELTRTLNGDTQRTTRLDDRDSD